MDRVILHSDMNNCYASVLNFFIIRSCAAGPLLSGEIRKPDTVLYLRRISWRKRQE